MPRRSVPFLIATIAVGSAFAADVPEGRQRPHPKIGTTVLPAAPYATRRGSLDVATDLLFTPADGMVRSIVPRFSGPLLPGSSTLPGYYGSSHSYDYQGPYYGGPYTGTWNRLPYACGVYGYC